MKIYGGKVSIIAKARNLAAAVADIARNPRMAGAEVFERRKRVCHSCEWFDAAGNLGLGECGKCGCTAAKLRFAASRCPAGRWK